jgi:uncharacterized metal-binding protein
MPKPSQHAGLERRIQPPANSTWNVEEPKMFCLTGVGGRVASILKITQAADRILAIDGCIQDCASSCLKEAGFEDFASLKLAELGMEKGLSPVTDENVARAAEAAARILAA